MMTERQKRICHKICEHYGVERQRRQLIEELGELITAICKYERSMYINDTDAVKQVVDRHKDVLTEIADVEIMLEQVKGRYFHDDDIAAEIDRKLERQLERMGEGDEE